MNYLKYSLSELKYFNIQRRICLKHRSTTAHTLLKNIKFLPLCLGHKFLSRLFKILNNIAPTHGSLCSLVISKSIWSYPKQDCGFLHPFHFSCVPFIWGIMCVFNYFNFFKFIFLLQFGVTDDHRKVPPHWPSGNATDHAHCSSLRAHLLVGSSILTYCSFNSYQIWP